MLTSSARTVCALNSHATGAELESVVGGLARAETPEGRMLNREVGQAMKNSADPNMRAKGQQTVLNNLV